VRVDVSPYYLPGNQAYYDSPMVEGPSPSRNVVVCSPTCAIARIRKGFEDLAAFATGMAGVSLLEDEFKPR
jgi:hypothetical protein